jgi:SAM-dependent methyltransferase
MAVTSDPEPALTDEQYRGMFEGLYARAGSNFAAVPWAALRPHPELARWLDENPAGAGRTALVVGCGLGDDAECAAAHGFSVTAFDFSPSAIRGATDRFPDSMVDYRVADLFDLPPQWRGAFDLVIEIRTLQSMPPYRRPAAVAAIATTLAAGGTLFVHSFGTADSADGTFDGPPWPVTDRQLAGFTDAGLARTDYRSTPLSARAWSFTAVYRRANQV